jgi:CBS domain-containing protein
MTTELEGRTIMNSPTVRDWMTTDPITVPTGTTLAAARARMQRDEVRHLLVLDDDGGLAGIVTWGDVMEAWPSDYSGLEPAEVRELMARVSVDEIMVLQVATIDPDATMSEAANLMFELRVGALPVTEDHRVVGILTSSDILQGLVRVLAGRG